MSDITVIGLGNMGYALANTLLSAGKQVSLWNRSQEKAESLVSRGANLASSVTSAIEASPVILVCVSNYSTTREIFASDGAPSALANRTVVQFSSGKPQDAIEGENWFFEQGARYLDGAILGSPKVIGTEAVQILVSGADNSWKACQPLLNCLAGNLQYVGRNVDSAKVLDLAWLSQRFGLFMGVFQGLLLCESAGVSASTFGATVAADQRVTMIADTIHNGSYTDPVNSIGIWHDALHHLIDQAKATNTDHEILEFIADKFQRARNAGYEEEDLAALIKIFKQV